jgi:AcrR family transcriptional regulator
VARKPGAAVKSRETSKEETREALLQAGLRAFAERGFDAPSLDAICEEAGYTRGAFYVHFRDRDDFLVACMERVLGPFLDAVIARGDVKHDLERTVGRFTTTVGAMAKFSAGGRRRRAVVSAVDVVQPAGGVPIHRLLDACERSPRLGERFATLVREAVDRVEVSARAGQGARTVRRDVEARQVGNVLVALALGAIVALELGIELDLDAAGRTVVTLLAP